MRRRFLLAAITGLIPVLAIPQQKTAAAKPPKTDLPYLLQADKLIPTDPQPATRSGSNEAQRITVNGSTSSARTPLPEPVFLLLSGKIDAARLELIHFRVADGRRQWTKANQDHSDTDEPEEVLRLTLRPVGEGVIRIEAAEMLNAGEYALIAQGQNTAFCFTVF